MKAVAVTSPGKVEIVDIPMPTIRDYECLVKNRASGLCNGTDLKIIHNQMGEGAVPYPVILGHEGVGEVVEVGRKVRNFQRGDLVLSPSGRLEPGGPYTWMWASMKEYSIAQDVEVMKELGVDASAYACYGLAKLPRALDPIDAGVILTLKECLSGLRNFGVRMGMEVLIYGDGPVALGLANFLHLEGAAWLGCIGHHSQRLRRIRERSKAALVLNAREEDVQQSMAGRRFDLVIDAVGSTAIVREGSQRLKPGGTVGVYGVLKKTDSRIDLTELQNNTAVHVLNWPYGADAVHQEIVDLIVTGRIDPKDYYSHVLPMEEAAKAVELVASREAFKVVLRI